MKVIDLQIQQKEGTDVHLKKIVVKKKRKKNRILKIEPHSDKRKLKYCEKKKKRNEKLYNRNCK